MYPIDFPESNKIFAKPSSMTEEQCKSMYVFSNEQQKISCWHLSFRERLQVLLFGKVWVNLLSKNQPPISLTIKSPLNEQATKSSSR